MSYLTIDQVADRYQLSPRTLYNQRAAGDMPGALGFNVGRSIRWDPADLDAFDEAAKAARVLA